MMMNKEINHECKRLLQGCDEINKVEREHTGRSKGTEKRTKSFYIWMMQEQLAILNNLEHQLSLMRRKNKSPKQ